jgi:hypothetical protein
VICRSRGRRRCQWGGGSSGAGRRSERALRACEGDVEEASFFFEAFGGCECHVGGEVAVAGGDDVDAVPFEAFGGVDGGEGEVVLFEVWWRGA